jgi:hypothetical protein
VVPKASFDGVGGHGLAAAAAGEELVGVLGGDGGQIQALVEVAQQKGGEGFGDRWRVAEAESDVAVVVEDSSMLRRRDPGEGLGIETRVSRGICSSVRSRRRAARRCCWLMGAGGFVREKRHRMFASYGTASPSTE